MGEIILDPRSENAQRANDGANFHATAKAAVLRGKRAPQLLRDELLPEIFEGAVTASPNALAMMTLERRFTYLEVDAQATMIARGLIGRGAGPGAVVGLWMADRKSVV